MDNEKLYREIIGHMREGAYFTDTDRRILFWNQAAESITGYKEEEIVGIQCENTPLKHIDGEGNLICVEGCPLHRAIIDGQHKKHDVFVKHKDGHRVAVTVGTFPVKENGVIIGAIEVFGPASLVIYDDELITQLASSAMNDKLTGLPNRRRVENFIDLRLREMLRYHYKVCVVFMDIDHFRDLNNNYGHDAGDAVLRTVSKTIMDMTRNTDMFGRWGGEEFVGIYTIKDDSDTFLIGEKIRSLVENTKVEYEGVTLSATVSIGATMARAGDSPETVVKRADELMYQSKQSGRNRVTTDAVL